MLTCDFPRGSNIVSNLVWERVGDRSYGSRRSQNGYRRSSSLRDSLGRRMRVRSIGDHGSELVIEDYTERWLETQGLTLHIVYGAFARASERV